MRPYRRRKAACILASPTTASTASASSLALLRASTCDLLLLHWPNQPLEAGSLPEVWGAMEAAVRAGQAGAIGVSNFNEAALAQLLASCEGRDGAIPPAVNQVESGPRACMPACPHAHVLT